MPRQKLYYLPGLISLIGLPILLALMGPEDPPERVCMSFYLASGKPDTPGVYRYTKEGFLQLTRRKKAIEIDMDDNHPLTENPRLYGGKFRYVIRELERMVYTHDSSSYLKLYFTGYQSTYGDFVWLCNQMKLFGIRHYALLDDCFYILPNPYRPAQ